MTTVPHNPVHPWVAAHRALLALIAVTSALIVAVVATLVVVLSGNGTSAGTSIPASGGIDPVCAGAPANAAC